MSYISGNVGEDCRILVYDTGTNVLVIDEVVSAGSFQFDDLNSNNKHIIAINEATGEAQAFGNVTPAGQPFLFTDYFPGTTLNTSKWDTNLLNGHIAVNERVELYFDTSRGGAHIMSKPAWNKTGSYKVWAKWKAGIDNYYNKGFQYPYVGFHTTSVSRGTYGEPTTNCILLRLGVSGNGSTRTGVTLTQNNSVLQTYGISIDMNLWHDIIVEYSSISNTFSFTLNDTVIINNRSLSGNTAWTDLRVAFAHTDFSSASVEMFDDIRIDQLA